MIIVQTERRLENVMNAYRPQYLRAHRVDRCIKWLLQHLGIQKEQRTERLVLRGRRNALLDGKIG